MHTHTHTHTHTCISSCAALRMLIVDGFRVFRFICSRRFNTDNLRLFRLTNHIVVNQQEKEWHIFEEGSTYLFLSFSLCDSIAFERLGVEPSKKSRIIIGLLLADLTHACSASSPQDTSSASNSARGKDHHGYQAQMCTPGTTTHGHFKR